MSIERNDSRQSGLLLTFRSRVEVGLYRAATKPWRHLKRGGQVVVGARKIAGTGIAVAVIYGAAGFIGGTGMERMGLEEQMEKERAYGHSLAEEANRDYDVCFAKAVNWLERDEIPPRPARHSGVLVREVPSLGKLSEEYEACRQEQRAEVLRIEANSAELKADWQRRREQQ